MKDRSESLHQPLLSTGDFANSFPSPPYRAFASSSQVMLASSPTPACPYPSEVDLINGPDDDEKKGAPSGAGVPQPKPSVHYPDSILHSPTAPSYHESPIEPYYSHGTASPVVTDDEDDYDWSGEEDLVDEEAKFEQQMGLKYKPRGCKRVFTLLLSSLIGSTLLSGILITPGILVHYIWYKNDPTPHRRFVEYNIQAWLFWAAANLLLSWYLAMAVNVLPVIVKFILDAVWGEVTEYVKIRLALYDLVKGTIKPVLYAASAWLSWVILFVNIYGLYNSGNPAKSWAPYTHRVAEVVEFTFFFVLALCIQKIISHAIAFMFHNAAYKERIDSFRESVRAIEQLRVYRSRNGRHSYIGTHSRKSSGSRTPVLSAFGFGGSGTGFTEKDHYKYLHQALSSASLVHSDAEDGDIEYEGEKRKSKGKQKRKLRPVLSGEETSIAAGTPYNMPSTEASSRPLTPSGLNPNALPHRYPPTPSEPKTERQGEGTTLMRAAKALKTAILHDARNVKGKEADSTGLIWNINSAHEAKKLAKKIYTRFQDRRRNFLIPADFHPAFATEAEAQSAFRVFDTDNNGDISRAEIKTTLLKVYKERRFLSRSMRDVGVALKTLDRILLLFALIIVFFISLSVFGVAVGNSLTSMYTIGIAASFVFKNAASSAFDAVIFLFVTHPFDTGDRCFINDENLVVKKMGLFATVFTRSDGTETYYSNSQLFTQFITNVRRSGKMFENCTLHVSWRTPLEKLYALEKCLNNWLANEENRWFEPSTSVTLQHIHFQRSLELTIGIGHNGTWQDWGLRNQRKTAFHAAVNYYCRQLGIVSANSPIPIVYTDKDVDDWTPMDDDDQTLFSPTPDQEQPVTENVKPVLGFLPPPEISSRLTRARKNKSRKAALRSMGADGS